MVYPQHCSDADTVKESEAGGENEQELLTNPEEPDLNSQTGLLKPENTLEVLSQEKEKELADAQAEQTGDTEQVKRDYLTAKKLDSIVEASKREEIEHAGFLLLPSVQEEAEVNSMVPEQERPCADPSMSSADMEIDEVLSSPCPGTSHVYDQLIEILHQQEEKCRRYCQQFSHIGNITETTKFERLAEECASQTEILKLASDRGYSAPNFQMEDRTFNIFRIIPELSGSEMVLTIVKGVNLPLPEGISPIDLDTSVRFMFAFPTSEEAQRDQTHSVKNSSSPEFGEQFTLHIKRNHRGFKRVILSKGIKFEIIQKGGLFKTDRVVGSAQMKLDSLETKCEIRQLIEVFRKRTPTGGYLEVQVKIREPLSGPQSETVTEKWLVLDPLSLPLVVATKPRVQENPVKQVTNRTVTCSVL
ncbi:coiled-coil and C2 domain-containing protein 1A-like isoform X4 [Hoplias malabaricus]|uniref:coiled-coil and C2 domain-containing protein 1A-like isoform X4 n=1 Tax=Hoplias malabaricus TaxID=27720 RepID=UPI003461EEE0